MLKFFGIRKLHECEKHHHPKCKHSKMNCIHSSSHRDRYGGNNEYWNGKRSNHAKRWSMPKSHKPSNLSLVLSYIDNQPDCRLQPKICRHGNETPKICKHGNEIPKSCTHAKETLGSSKCKNCGSKINGRNKNCSKDIIDEIDTLSYDERRLIDSIENDKKKFQNIRQALNEYRDNVKIDDKKNLYSGTDVSISEGISSQKHLSSGFTYFPDKSTSQCLCKYCTQVGFYTRPKHCKHYREIYTSEDSIMQDNSEDEMKTNFRQGRKKLEEKFVQTVDSFHDEGSKNENDPQKSTENKNKQKNDERIENFPDEEKNGNKKTEERKDRANINVRVEISPVNKNEKNNGNIDPNNNTNKNGNPNNNTNKNGNPNNNTNKNGNPNNNTNKKGNPNNNTNKNGNPNHNTNKNGNKQMGKTEKMKEETQIPNLSTENDQNGKVRLKEEVKNKNKEDDKRRENEFSDDIGDSEEQVVLDFDDYKGTIQSESLKDKKLSKFLTDCFKMTTPDKIKLKIRKVDENDKNGYERKIKVVLG